MSVSDVLQKGSYNGVDFLFSSNSQKSGRKLAVFEYPESDIRTVQDLGKFLPVYNLNIKVTGDEDTYLQKRAKLINALDTPASSFLLNKNQSTNLVHPIDGAVRAAAGEYTISEDTTRVGVSIFSVKFYAIKEVVYPTQSTSNASNIDNIFDTIIDDIRSGFESAWDVLINLENDLNKASQYIYEVNGIFSSVIGLVNVLPNAISNFLNQIQDVQDTAVLIAQSPLELSNKIAGIFSQLQNITGTTSNRTILNKQLFNVDVGTKYENNTISRVNSEKNRKTVNTFVNSLAFSYEVYNTSIAEYTNTDDINKQVDNLSNQHFYIVNNNFYFDNNNISKAIFNEDIIDSMTKLYDYGISYLQEQKANSKNISTVDVINNNLLNLVYAYYDVMTEYDEINLLNDIGDPTSIQGYFEVLI
jgi:prophage DNA circulation protein